MATKNLVPRTGSQGGIGTDTKPWKEAIFSTGLLHLKHEINSRENFTKNDKLLHEKQKWLENTYSKNWNNDEQ